MSIKNFVPEIWAAGIEKDRDMVTVATKLCNRDYEGDIKQFGDRVKINGISRPTIVDYDDESGFTSMERLADQSTMLEITQQKGFNFYVGDIDKRQAKGDVMSEERREAGSALAEAEDSYIYNELVKDASKGGGTTFVANDGTTKYVEGLDASNVLSTITRALTMLYKNNVPRNETISLECSPRFLEKLILSKILNDTDNSSIITSGFVQKMKTFNIDVYMTNNLPTYNYTTTSGSYTDGEYAILRTKKAVSFASQITKVKAYEPEDYMGEAVKGLDVYGAKIIRPKEAIIIPVHGYDAETNI